MPVAYEIPENFPIQPLLAPLVQAEDALARLDKAGEHGCFFQLAERKPWR